MRALALIVVVLAGCDLQPPPKKQQPTAQRPGQTGPNAGSGSGKTIVVTPKSADKPPAPPPGAGTGSAAAPAAPQGPMSCLDIGTRFADIYVKTSKDASEKATLEQERTTLVKSVSERCNQGNWNDDIRGCFAKAADRDELTKCTNMVRVKNDGNPATP